MKKLNTTILALCMLLGMSQILSAQTISIQDARNTANGDTVTVKGVVTLAQGRQVFIQDGTAAILAFQSSGALRDSIASGFIAVGDSLEITGELTEFSTLKQFSPVVSFSRTTRGNKLPAYQVLTIAEITANGEDYESELVRVFGLSFANPQSGNWSTSTNYDVTDGVNTMVLRTPSGGDSPLIGGTPLPTEPFVFEGPLGTFNNVYQLSPWVPEDAYNPYGMSLFHNNDAESNMLGASDTAGPQDFGGAAYFKSLVDSLRAASASDGMAVVTLTSGDNFLAGKEFDASLTRDPSLPFYDAIVIDSIGYDALCIGNHEFDFGPDVLADLIGDVSTAPFLSANLDVSGEPSLQALASSGRIAPRTILTKNGELVGVIGATTPNLPFISSPGQVVVNPDVAGVISEQVDSLKAAGVNKIILISHLQGVEEDTALARSLNDIDIIIAGGGDELLANPSDILIPGDNSDGPYPLKVTDVDGDTVLVVTTAGNFEYLGNLDAYFSARGEIINFEGGPVRVSAIAPDAALPNPGLVDNVIDSLLLHVAELSATILANSEVELDGRRSTVRAREGNEGNLIADALLWQANAVADDFGAPQVTIAIANGGGIRNDNILPTGDITEANTFDMLPFGNKVTIVEAIPPALLKEIVENCVSRVDTGSGTGRFGNYAGMKIVYDPAETRQLLNNGVVTQVGNRVVTITLDDGTPIVKEGTVVANAPTINIALPDFLARGGDQYPTANQNITLLPITGQQALKNYLTGPLDSVISEAEYPEGGDGRIFALPFDPDSVLTVEQARLFPNGDTVTIQAVITRAKGRLSHLQEGSFAIATFQSSGAYRDSIDVGAITNGDIVKLKGELDEFAASKQFSPVISFEKISSGNPLPPVQPISLSDIIGPGGELYESELVLLNGLSVANNPGGNWSDNTSYDIFDLVGDTVELRTPGGFGSDTDIDTQPIPAGTFVYEGVINNRNDGYRPFPIDSTDIRAGFTLTILHNNDAESQIVDAGGGREEFGGAARFKTVVDQLKGEATSQSRPSVMLSSGDNFLAGKEFNASLTRDPSLPFYDAVVVDSIGYDALAIGNHEFDFGPDILADFINDISVTMPPFLSANLDVSGEANLDALATSGRIASSVVIDRGSERIGVIGATTPNLPFISSPRNVVVSQDVAAAVQAEVDALSGQGINKIILISHLQDIGEDSVLASQVRGIDVLIAGGGDDLLANPDDLLIPGDSPEGPYPKVIPDADGNNVYLVTTSGSFRYVGQLIVAFDDAGEVSMINPGSGPVRVSTIGPDAVVANQGVQENVVDSILVSIAGLEANVLGVTDVALDGRRSSIRSIETNEGNLVADAFRWYANENAASAGAPNVQIAMGNGGGIRNDNIIAAGSNLTEATTFDILPFTNFITVVEDITPAQFKFLVENAVSRINTNLGGTGRFPQISGFTFTYDSTQTPAFINVDGTVADSGSRVCSIMLDDSTMIVDGGSVVAGAPTVNLATVNFLAAGGDQYPLGDNPRTLLPATYQQALAEYIVNGINGRVTADDYPEGGEGRSMIISSCAATGISDLEELLEFKAYPNPAREMATLSYRLENTANVELTLMTPMGQLIKTLVSEEQYPGVQETQFSVADLPMGMYLIRLVVDGQVALKRMTILD
ncbi:MAG: 5'-nucleotidase C-terminal domain-containing protein [Bacteroidota bacterium]